VLLNRPGKTASNPAGYPDSGFDVTFQTGAANGDLHLYQNVTTPADGSPITGVWQPDGRTNDPVNVTDASGRFTALTNFNGLSANGEWTLYLADLENGGTNQLTEWGLDITGVANPTLVWTNPANIVYGTALGGTQLNATATYNSTNVPGTYTYSPAAGTVLNAGSSQTLTVIFTPTDTNSYLPVTNQVVVNVLNASLIVTADSTNKVYGAALPTFTASYSGFVNGDTAASLGTAVTLGTAATSASPIGTYAITASGAVGTNYTITHVNGTLTIDTAPLTITANNTNKVYGAALPTFTASYSGFVNGDTAASLGTAVTLGTAATSASPIGTYAITASGAIGTNYAITHVNGTLTIDTAQLTITANNTNKVYGAALPTFTASYSGFVNGDTAASLGTAVTLGTAATSTSPAGAYTITASGAIGTNYAITHVNGTLTIGMATLTINADDKTKAYGQALPTLTATYNGFVNGDDTNSLTALAILATTATAGSNVGTYPITASGASSTNYSFNYVDGTLTITNSLTSGDLVSSANPALPGADVTFTMTVSAVAPGDGTPNGTVTFKADGNILGTGSLSGGQAAFTTNNLAHGSHTVVAEYAGNANFGGSTNTLSPIQVINTPPVAGGDTIERYPTQGVKVRLAELLGKASDADSDTLNITVSPASASNNTVTVSGAWVFFTPAPGFTNADSFTYTVTDGHGGSATGTVTVAIKVDAAPSQNLVIVNLDNGSFRIDGNGIPGRTYRLQYSDATDPFVWNDLVSMTADSVGAFQYTDSSGSPMRFYRTVYP
jgi:subtilisin-like proprotein convertase family protein